MTNRIEKLARRENPWRMTVVFYSKRCSRMPASGTSSPPWCSNASSIGTGTQERDVPVDSPSSDRALCRGARPENTPEILQSEEMEVRTASSRGLLKKTTQRTAHFSLKISPTRPRSAIN